VVINGADGLAHAAGDHGQDGGPVGGCGGIPASGGLAEGRGGVSAGGWGGGPGGGSGPAPAPGKGKQARVVLDDDEVSSDEDKPLQKQLQWLSDAVGPSGRGPAPAAPYAVAMMAAAADKEATDKRATEEAAVTRAAEEAMEKAVANKEATNKSTADEAAVKGAAIGAVRDSPAPGQVPSIVLGTKRAAAPSGSTRRPNDPTTASGNLGLSNPPPPPLL
jgi:hypothetical protein